MTTEAKNAEALEEISTLVFSLSHVYPKQAADYRKHCADERKWDAMAGGTRPWKDAERWRDQSQRFADTYRDLCNVMVGKLSHLARLVAIHFPEFDGKLRAVRFHAEHWHDKPPEEWEPLLEELLKIQAAVLRAVESPADTSGQAVDVDMGAILAEHRTKPMTITEAGWRLGLAPPTGTKEARRDAARQGARRMMDSGGLRHEKMGNLYVFDKRQVPDEK